MDKSCYRPLATSKSALTFKLHERKRSSNGCECGRPWSVVYGLSHSALPSSILESVLPPKNAFLSVTQEVTSFMRHTDVQH